MAASLVSFLEGKLLLPPGHFEPEDATIKRVNSRPDSAAKDQVVVTFTTVRLRDEVKSLGRNLSGSDNSVGMQIEPPDHLRSHYQLFQKLAYQLKKKYPNLRRSIKFSDIDKCLSMDVLLSRDAQWRTIAFEDARSILRKVSRTRTESVTLEELEEMVDVAPGGRRKRMRPSVAESDDSMNDSNDNTVVDLTENENVNKSSDKRYPSSRSLSFINTNARSLAPKLESLFDCFSEKQLDFAMLTETWLQNHDLSSQLERLAGDYSLSCLARNRSDLARNGRQYGGVALLFRKKTSSFKEFPLNNPENFEVLAASGKVHGIKEKLFCITCYAPPNIPAARANKLVEFVSDVVTEAKRKFCDSLVVVAGDFNQWSLAELLLEHPDLTETAHGPTRGDRCIDRSFTNFGRSITASGTLEPLQTEDGLESDHKIAFSEAEFERRCSKQISYSYQAYSHEGSMSFLEELAGTDWQEVLQARTTDSKVEIFQTKLQKLMDEHFPWKTTVRRETDPPWINDYILNLIAKRRKIYDREGRSPRWKKLKKRTARICKKRARVYMQRQKETMTAPDASRAFFKNVKAYQCREKPPEFNPRDLYPENDDKEVAEKLASHFNSISSEFDGLDGDATPQSFDLLLPPITEQDLVSRLRKMRKPKSRVLGDIFPDLVNRAAPFLAGPLSDIYNLITSTGIWPARWKIEYVTPIPKKTIPESADDLRNISCTQFFSKAYESFILEWLNSQISIRSNQYGGIKGSGSEHFLVELWQRALENLEDQRAGTLLTSIDYSKAFNRLDFSCCLKALKAKGACTGLISIVSSFLTGRKMMVKIGNTMSDPRAVLGGVPQGSLLGVLLFNICIDDFEAHSRDTLDYNPTDYTAPDQAPNPPTPTPVPEEPTGRDYRHLPQWAVELLQVLKYVDDNIIQEKLNFDSVPTDGSGTRSKHAIRTENLFRLIVHQALSCGMKVNSSKTNCLCISELKDYFPRAFFEDSEGDQIVASDTMKILGFEFSSEPNMAAQVKSIQTKFRARKWILVHLGHHGFSKSDLLKVYKSVILPVHDYCSCVYNSSLTATQANALERLQAQALKAIYGYEHSYRSLLEQTGLTTLKARRDA